MQEVRKLALFKSVARLAANSTNAFDGAEMRALRQQVCLALAD